MHPPKRLLHSLAVAALALALSGCDLCDCLCHKKKEGPDWAAVNQARLAGGATSGGGGGTGGGGGGTGGGGHAVPEISPRAAAAGLTLLAGLAFILADCRRPGRRAAAAAPS